MLTLREWVVSQLSGQTTFYFFNACWLKVNKPCQSNRIVMDAHKYNEAIRGGRIAPIPKYVEDEYNKLYAASHVMPDKAYKANRWTDTWNHQQYRLVCEPDTLLVARKCADGVWRCV